MGILRQIMLLPGFTPVYLQDLLKRLDGGWHCMARMLDHNSVVTYTGTAILRWYPRTPKGVTPSQYLARLPTLLPRFVVLATVKV